MAESSDITARDAHFAAETAADIGVEHIADVYAKALLGAAEKTGQSAAVVEELESLVADVLDRLPKLDAVLSSVLVGVDDKVAMLDRALGGQASPLLLIFLKVVARHGRLDCLRTIRRQARKLFDKLHGRIRVQLTTATPLDGPLTKKLVDALRLSLGGEPVVTQRVDPALIGGAVVRIGDTVHDGSIANQLKSVRQQMMDRSAHEIQSRRDRFRSPAGN